jgi:polyphosphate glucokinase
VGGTNAKFLISGQRTVRRIPTGERFTPVQLVRAIQAATARWRYDAIALGFPGRVGEHGPLSNPDNLGRGWAGFDFGRAFGVPVRIMNDAAMQALGSYEGGRMLFLGLGTGLGSALVSGRTIISLELGRLWWRRHRTLGECTGKKGLKRLGRKAWRRLISLAIPALQDAVMADYVVLGGGNVEKIGRLPRRVHRGHNDNALHGGFRLWNVEGVPVHQGGRRQSPQLLQNQLPWRSV